MGARFFYDNQAGTALAHFFPEASIRFQIVDKALVSFFGVTGYIENNNYADMSWDNPYLVPGIMPKNTIHRFVGYGGIEGRLSRKSSYRLSVTFEARENVIFFINDTLTRLENQFLILYDDADLITYNGEIQWSPYSHLSFFLKSHGYTYKMTSLEKPWHKPSFDLLFSTRYIFKQKIYAGIEFLTLGKRYARNNTSPADYIELDPVFDLNLKLEYKYSNVLTGYVHFYNLLAQKYYAFNQYPSQRLNVLLGVTYKF